MTNWADLDPSGPWLIVSADRSCYQLCEAVPGCNYRKDSGLWRAPLTWAAWVALHVAWAGVPLAISPRLHEAAAWWQAQVNQRMADRLALDAAGEDLELIAKIEAREGTARHLDAVQRGSAAWLCRWGRKVPGLAGACYVDPVGNGKTGAVVRAMQMLAGRGQDPYPALWICRGAALYDLRDKIAAWAPELAVSVVTGTAGARQKALAEQADIYLLAWPNLRYHTRLARYPSQEFTRCAEHGGSNPKIKAGGCEVHDKELQELGLRTVIADEAHSLADARSKQTRAAWHLAHNAAYFWPVTGTPVPDNISAVWSLLHALDPAYAPSRSRFLDLLAEKNYDFWGETILGIRPDQQAAFDAITQPLFRRIPREVARPSQPPRLEPEFRRPEMTRDQKRHYDQLRAELLADLEDRTIVPDNTAVLFGRLRQLASSDIEQYDGEDGDGFTKPLTRLCLPSNKADDLTEFLGDTDDQVVVALFSPALAELCARKLDQAKITHTAITGQMTPEQRYAANREFADGRARVIFITAAGGESIDLQSSHTIYFAEPNPSYVGREQAIGRVDRWGQEHGVRIVHCLSPGSVDGRLHALGNEKEERAAQVTRDADLLRWLIGGDDQDD